MSHAYHFLCIACREVLDLGKIVDVTERDMPRPLGWGGWRDLDTGEWLSEGRLFAVLERWLILHRSHELVVVPEVFLVRADRDDTLRHIDTAKEVMERGIEPEPDDERDAANVPDSVRQRIASPRGSP